MKNSIALLCVILLLVLVSDIDAWRGNGKLLKFASKCKADAREPWSYRGNNGPLFWGASYSECNGQKQSPIAIYHQEAILDDDLDELNLLNYDIPVTRATVENNGHTIEVTPTDEVQRSIYVDGETYALTQFHFHWGDAYYHGGSEHTIDGHHYSLEMHLVHQNDNDEIAVMAVFFQEQIQKTHELQHLIKIFPKVMYKDDSTELNSHLHLNKLLPTKTSSFYRYQGSLTTPACTEGVTWTVLPQALPIGIHQMAEFRKLYSATKSEATPKCKISNNYRPIQPLNGRTVFVSQ